MVDLSDSKRFDDFFGTFSCSLASALHEGVCDPCGRCAFGGSVSNAICADPKGADLSEIKWDDGTECPNPDYFEGAKHIPYELKKQSPKGRHRS